MVCPNCHKEYSENQNGRYCPNCGIARAETVTPANVQTTSTLPLRSREGDVAPVKINWMIIFGALLVPPLLTLLTAFLTKGQAHDQISPSIGFFGGGLGGIACGIMLALRVSKTVATRWLLGIAFAVIFAIVGVTLGCFGCLAGGYDVRFG